MMQRLLAGGLACVMLCAPALAQENEIRPPFVTTPHEVVEAMLDLAQVGREDTLIDLGSGDGRIVIAAARTRGTRGHGVELDAGLVQASRRAAEAAGVDQLTRFTAEDALLADISPASVVTVYLLPSLLDRLQPRFLDLLRPGTRIVSHAFLMTGWRPDRSETVRLAKPHPSQGDASVIHLWVVPAQARGLWIGEAAGLGAIELRIEQNFQQIELAMRGGGAPMEVGEARLSGAAIDWRAGGVLFRGRVNGPTIEGLAESGGRELPFRLGRRAD